MQLPATAAGPAPAAIALASLSPACGGCEPGGRRNVPSVQDTPACPGAAAARANARGRVRVRLLPRHGRVRADSGARRPGTESSGSAARLGPAPPARRAATPDTVRLPKAAQADSCRIEVKGRSRPGGQPKQRLPPRRSRGRGSSWPALQPARLPHKPFRVSSHRRRAARRTRRVPSTARSRAGRAHRQAGAFLS